MPARTLYLCSFVITLSIFPFLVFNLLLLRTPLLPDTKSFVISSGSMEPVLPVGSIIYTLRQSEYKAGEVVAFLKNKTTISHRVIGLKRIGNDTYYVTKGDANTVEDSDLVLENSVIGKVVAFVPFIGNIILFYKNPIGIILGTVLPALFFLVGPWWGS